MRSKRRKHKRKHLSIPEISLTPLIDTALTLLIIFMITTPMMKRSSIKVDLPKTEKQEQEQINQDSLVVDINKDGIIYIDDAKLDSKALVERITAIIKKNPKNSTVYINADKALKYQEVIGLFDRISGVEGVQRVALVTEKTT